METINDMEFLGARLHGRRSRLAEGDRLDGLCRLGSLPPLFDSFAPAGPVHATSDFQRHLVESLCREIFEFTHYLQGAVLGVVEWMLVRFQVENLKLLARGLLRSRSLEEISPRLLPLPNPLVFAPSPLVRTGSFHDFAALLPDPALRESTLRFLKLNPTPASPFVAEAILDMVWLREWLRRIARLPPAERMLVRALAQQEADMFHLLLVARGKFHFHLDPALLRPLHVAETQITRGRFDAMLAAPDLRALAQLALGRVIDVEPAPRQPQSPGADFIASDLETLARNRLLRLANRAFRRSHMGPAAVIGYIGIRRMEIANLITISEGLRLGASPESIRVRLLPRKSAEAVYV